VVSESFVVATKRVKHAIKSDIPSIGDHISKLVHIGKATVDKLQVGTRQTMQQRAADAVLLADAHCLPNSCHTRLPGYCTAAIDSKVAVVDGSVPGQ